MDEKNGSLASAIVASMPSDESSVTGGEAQELNAEDVVVDEMLTAMKNSDTGAFRDALRSFIQMTSDSDDTHGE